MKLPAPFAIALQSAFKHYAALDPDSAGRLQRLRGKVVCLEMQGIDLSIWFIFNETSVEVVEEFADQADAVISGGPFSLLSLATGRRTIFDGDVTLSGDTETAQKFSRCLSEIDIDWEEHLSTFTGDAVAHRVGRFSSGLKNWLSERQDSVQESTADYLRDESNNVPHSWELEEFVEQVDDLRDRVDALEARLQSVVNAKTSGSR